MTNPIVPQPGLAARGWGLIERRTRRVARHAGAMVRNGQAEGLERLRALSLSAPSRALVLARRGRMVWPRSRFFAEAEALLTARTAGWAAAEGLFANIAGAEDSSGPSATVLLRSDAPTPTLELAVPAAARPEQLPEAQAARAVVYTAVFGARPQLPPVAGIARHVRFVCFTDQPVEAAGWEVVPGAGPAGDVACRAAFHRICAGEVLAGVAPDAEWSLYLAHDRLLAGNPHTLLTRWLIHQDLAMWRHARCGDWHDLAEYHLIEGTAAPEAVIAQAAAFAEAGVPRNRGVCETGAVWRRHAAPDVAALMRAWWEAHAALPGAEDMTFYRLLNGPASPAIRPRLMPAVLGDADDNAYVVRTERRPPPRPGRPPSARGRLGIAFLYSRELAHTASTVLRGQQVSAMITERFPDIYDVTYVDDPGALRDQVVVLVKGAMQTFDPATIGALRERNILAIGCWDDVIPDPEKVRALDAHMTLAYRQTLELNRQFPSTPAFLMTHHVNPQVPHCRPPMDRLRTGYFGDLGNTVRPASLEGMIDLVGINTMDVNARNGGRDWLAALPDYNCHWIVRNRRPWDGWKPFLKGFVAARCGAVIVVTRDDGDARHYLGDDYPFYAGSLEAEELEMALLRVAAAFDGPDWRMAQAIMAQIEARSTDAHVCAEFKAMIDELTA